MNEDLNVFKSKQEIIASHSFPVSNILVDVVNFLNKSLKNEGYIFGVSKSGDKMNIAIYECDKKPRS